MKLRTLGISLECADSGRISVIWVSLSSEVCVCVIFSVSFHLFIYLTIIHWKLTMCQALGRRGGQRGGLGKPSSFLCGPSMMLRRQVPYRHVDTHLLDHR